MLGIGEAAQPRAFESEHRQRPQTSRLTRLIAVGVTVPMLFAACSSEKETTQSASTDANCKQDSGAKERYERSWAVAQKQLGLSGIKPTPLKLCDVETTKYKKKAGKGRLKVAFAAQGPTNSWGSGSEEAFRYHAEQRKVDVQYASANGDATKQVDNIQQLASREPDAMVVVPMGAGITGQVRSAADQGIPVVLCAGRLEGNSGAVSTVARSYELQGTLFAEWLVKELGGKGRVAMLSGIAGVPTAEYQKVAAEKVFAKYPDIKIVAKEYTDWSATKARTVARTLVAKDLDGVWADSAISDLGVYQAYTAAGKPVPPVTGDTSNAFLKAVDGSDVKFAASSFPPEQSTECLDIALDAVAGKPVPNVVSVETPAFTQAELKKYVRPECSDNLWIPTTLPDELIRKLKLC